MFILLLPIAAFSLNLAKQAEIDKKCINLFLKNKKSTAPKYCKIFKEKKTQIKCILNV